MVEPFKLLGIFAHPDDEAFGTGGTLSKYAAEGVDVHLITATCGEAGQIVDDRLATQETLCQVRVQELQRACQAYDINSPHLLYYPDGQMTIVNQKEAVGKIVKLIRELKPQVIMTFGPDGVYGHYDHIACHRWATIAFRLAADPEWYPEQIAHGLRPHTVAKLYYRATSQKFIDAMRQNGRGDVMMDGVPFSFFGYDDDQITTVIDIRDYVYPKRRGILCHATQITDRNRFLTEDELLTQALFQQETFIRAKSLVSVDEAVETDLFTGLRD